MPVMPLGGPAAPGGPASAARGAPAARSSPPPWQAGSQAQRDLQTFRGAQGATPQTLGPATNIPLIVAATQANTLFTMDEVRASIRATETPEDRQRRLSRMGGHQVGTAVSGVLSAVAIQEGIHRAIQEGLAQAKIQLQLNANISPDGITAQATARQNGRAAQSPIVRSDYGGQWTG